VAEPSQPTDASRRTRLAAERTWLAWWRTALGGAAVSIAVGRFLPSLTHEPRWPFAVLGLGYGLLAVAVLLIGTVRERRISRALRHGGYVELSGAAVWWLTAAALVLAIGTLVIIAAKL
jgi:uncharacterized membrane protein YidH (DUF202 family)